MKRADLHIHTTHSDGHLTPQQVIAEAITAGLSCIAITDHDTLSGYLALQANNQLPPPEQLAIIPGIEFSTDLPEHEVHILGYHLNPQHAGLVSQLQKLTQHRQQRVAKMVEKITALGYALNMEEVYIAAQQATSLGRPHIAKALVRKGYFSTVGAVFDALIDKNAPAYVPHYKLTPQEVITLIRDAGGIPVLAHPGLVKSDAVVADIIALGISGLEAYHPHHTPEEIKKYAAWATTEKLLITGGSDYHAIPARYPERLGLFTVPLAFAAALRP